MSSRFRVGHLSKVNMQSKCAGTYIAASKATQVMQTLIASLRRVLEPLQPTVCETLKGRTVGTRVGGTLCGMAHIPAQDHRTGELVSHPKDQAHYDISGPSCGASSGSNIHRGKNQGLDGDHSAPCQRPYSMASQRPYRNQERCAVPTSILYGVRVHRCSPITAMVPMQSSSVVAS